MSIGGVNPTDPIVPGPAFSAPSAGLGSLERFAGRSHEMDEKEMKEVATKLEGVFVSMLVKTMRETFSEDGLFGDGSSGEIYGGFFDQAMGEALAEKGGLGISEMVVRSAWRGADAEEKEGEA